MAEQNNEKQTINFAGREIDRKEFGRRVQAKLGAWMDYQGLRGEERTDFIQAINDKMNGLLDGTLTSSEFGVIEGGAPNQENQYKQNGSRSEGFSLSRRHGFNPGENADIFLNGIAGTMDEGASTGRRSSKKAATWDKSLSAKQVTDSIFGEGNEETIAQLKLWADQLDPVVNGVRSTEGRKGHIKLQLDKYIKRLNNGEFDISDEDREEEIKRIGELKNALNNNNSFELGKLAPWVSNLLFTEENYYNTPEERQAAEQQNLAKQAEEYIKNGGENPYNKETDPDKWQAAEDARKAQLDLNFVNEFDNYSTRSTQLRGEHWLPKWDKVSSNDVFADWDYNGAYGWKHMLDALYKVNTDYSGDLGLGADLETGWFGIGGAKSVSNDSFRGIVPDAYIDEVVEPNDWLSGHQTQGSHMFRSANAYKGKFLSDYLNHFITDEEDRFRIAPNTSQYLLPSMVDWNNGTAYVITRGMNQKSRIKQVNIADLLKSLKENNPGLYQELFQSYAEFKGHKLTSAKNGGVLKAQFGGGITKDTKDFDEISAQETAIDAMGLKNFDRQNLGNQVIEGNDVNLSTLDWMRIGSAAADLTSAVAAFVPGYGTAVAAATGIGSSLTNLAADWSDPAISTGETIKNLGINLGLDIVSLIPGLNIGAGAAKIVKPIAKLVPKLLPLAVGANMAPDFIEMLKKVGNGKNDFTANDLRILAQGMSVIAGTSRVGASTLKASKYNKSGYGKTKFTLKLPGQKGTGEFPVEFTHNGTTKTSSLTLLEIKDINAGGKDNALKLFRQKIAAKTGIKEDEISFAGKTAFDKKLPFMNRKLKPAGDELLTLVDKTPEMLKFYTERFNANADLRARYPHLSRIFKTDLEMLGIVPTTNPGHFWHNDIYSPFAFRYPRIGTKNVQTAERKAGLITEAQSRMNEQPSTPTSSLKTQIDEINAKKAEVQKSVKENEHTVRFAQNSDKRIANLNNQRSDLKIVQMERQLKRLQSIKKGQNSPKRQLAILDLQKRIRQEKAKQSRIDSRILEITKAKSLEATAKQNAETGRKSITKFDEQLAKINNDLQWDTYNHYRDLVRRIYGLKHGGIIKANIGVKVPDLQQNNTGTTSNAGAISNTGTTSNIGSTTAATNIGSVGGSNTGSVGEAGNPTPSSTTYNAYDNGFMPEEQSSIYPSDIMQTLLQLEGNNAAHRYNYAMTQQQLSKIPYHKTPMIYGYKVHTSKPIEDQIAQTRALYNQMGNTAARGTADLGAAFAYRLTAANKATEATNPLTLKQSEFVQNGEDKAREAAYKTAESYHDVGDFNHEQDVKDYNDERDIWTQYLSQEGRIKMKDIALRQRGLAATSEQNYRRSVLAKQAEYTYRRLSEKKATHPEDWTDDDEQQLERAYRTWTQVNTPAPLNMPYAGFSNYYTAQRPLSNFSYWNN